VNQAVRPQKSTNRWAGARALRSVAFVLIVAIVAAVLPGAVVATPAGAATTTEQEGSLGVNTFSNYHNASGFGPRKVNPYEYVQVSCKVYDPTIGSVNPDGYWYRLASSPWNDAYYSPANTFWNGDIPGHTPYTHNTDFSVPDCSAVQGTNETTGGVTHTFTDYTNAGGTQGQSIGSNQIVQVQCALTGFRVADGNTWWYRIATAPWNNVYYASADAFYNNGQTSGSLIGTPFVDPAVPQCSPPSGGGGTPGPGTNEQEGHYGVNTFQNYQNASGLGPRIDPAAWVQVSCKVYAPAIASVNPDGYWYKIANGPWNNQYYAPANTFMNGDPWGGPYSHNTDSSVPDCGNAPRGGGPTVSLAQGVIAPYGYRYAVTLSGFAPSSSHSVRCYYSNSASFYNFSMLTDGSGGAFTQNQCFTNYGPDHWVVVDGVYPSNHVGWGVGSGGGTGQISSTRAGNQGSTPPTSQKSTTCHVTVYPVNCATGDFWHSFTDFSVPGRGLPLNFAHTYTSSAAGTPGRLGFGWTDSYNMSLSTTGNTVTVTEENGVTVSFTSDGNGGFTPPTYVLATLKSNPDGTYTFTRVHSNVRYVFSQYGQLLSEIDRNGYTTTLNYSGAQLSSITDPAGRSLSLTYNGSQISQITDPLGRIESFTYNEAGDLTSVTNPAGGTWLFTYDTNHLLLTMTNPRGGVVTNVFGASARVVSQTDPAGLTTTWSYSGDNASVSGGVTTLTDPNGIVTTYGYQSLELQSVTHASGTPLAATTSYTYDPNTLGITSTTDPNGHTTNSTYDTRGNLLSTTDALGRATSYTYDSFNDPLTVTDALGKATTSMYDGNGNLLTRTGPIGDVTTFAHSDANHPGDITTAMDPDGRITTFTYDGQGDVASKSARRSSTITDTTQLVYDADGEQVCRASANAVALGVSCPATGTARVASTTTTNYDPIGEVLSVTDPNGHKTDYSYDANGNRTSVADASSHATMFSYDADNHMTTTAKANGSLGSTSYDNNGNVVTTTDGNGRVTTNAYDALNRQTSTTNPLGQTTIYRYDLAGNKTSVVDASQRVTTYIYDNANELTSVSYSDGLTPGVTYTYDAVGRRKSMTDGTGSTTYNYDDGGRMTSLTDGSGSTASYGYDLAGHPASITYPNGKTVFETYDGAGNLTAVKDWVNHTSTFEYDADGNVKTQVAGSTPAVKDSYGYDANDQLMSIGDSIGATTLQSFSYARTPTDLVSSVTPNGSPILNYSYDPANQVAHDSQGAYAYDPAGNVTKLITATKPLAYDAGNELITNGKGNAAIHLSYDSEGDRSAIVPHTGPSTTYGYDQVARLVGFSHGATTAAYAYDGDGTRTAKTVGTVKSKFFWDHTAKLPALLSDGTASYIYGPSGLPLETISKAGVVRFFHHDQLGNTTMLTSVKGVKGAIFTYSSFGKRLKGSATATPLQYGGQYFDSESGLYYLRARYYDSTLGSFLTVDPALATTHSPYGYTGNNPINSSDPSGLLVGGLCLGQEASFVGGLTGQQCIIGDGHSTVPLTSLGVEAGLVAGLGGSAYEFWSTARSVSVFNDPTNICGNVSGSIFKEFIQVGFSYCVGNHGSFYVAQGGFTGGIPGLPVSVSGSTSVDYLLTHGGSGSIQSYGPGCGPVNQATAIQIQGSGTGSWHLTGVVPQ
jgi:RHS repeat-associated protein